MRKPLWQAALILGAAAIIFLGNHLSSRLLSQTPPSIPTDDSHAQPAQAGGQASGGQQSGSEEVLTRGPVHEAFAEVINYNPQPGQVVAKEPPKPIEEVPPAEKPEGDYTWIPGYWAWDHDRGQLYLGHRRMADSAARHDLGARLLEPGHQRTSMGQRLLGAGGTRRRPARRRPRPSISPRRRKASKRAPAQPPPRPTISGSPAIGIGLTGGTCGGPATGPAASRIGSGSPPGTSGRPAATSSSPGIGISPWQAGRGLLPGHLRQPLLSWPALLLQPSVCIQTPVLTGYLFCRPAYCHYYFGDYYDPMYVGVGIYPWYMVHERHYGYEPLFVYDRWYYGRNDPGWAMGLHRDYEYRVAHFDARPPHTYAAAVSLDVRAPAA